MWRINQWDHCISGQHSNIISHTKWHFVSSYLLLATYASRDYYWYLMFCRFKVLNSLDLELPQFQKTKDILSLLGEFASLDQESSEPFHLHFNQSCMKNGNWGLYSRIHIYNSKQDYLFSHIWFPLCVLLLFTIVTGLEYWNLASPWMIWTTLCLSWFINIL